MPKGNRQLNETIKPEDANLWDKASDDAKSAMEKATETVKQISSMSVIPKPTKETQIIISRKKADGTLEEIQADFAQAKALPVSDFTVVKQEEKWSKTVAPYSSDLVAYIDFDSDTPLVPKVGNFTMTPTGTTVVDGYHGKGRRFAGGTDKVACSAKVIPIGAKSIRVKAMLANTSGIVTIMDDNNSASTNWGISIRVNNGQVEFLSGKGTGGTYNFYLTSSNAITVNTWSEIICTWDGLTTPNGVKIYIDGILGAQGTALAASTTLGDSNTAIGSMVGGTTVFNGILDEIEIYNTVKTPTDFAKDPANLKLDWKNSTNTFFTQDTIIRRSDAGYPTTITDGELVTETTAESFVDTIADTSKNQYYSAFGNNGIVASNAVNAEYKPEPGYLMLYDAGDECIAITGGWGVKRYSSSYTSPTLTKSASNMVLSATNPQTGYCYTVNAVDVTSYGKLKVKVLSITANSSETASFGLRPSLADESGITVIKTLPAIVNTPTTYEIDISSVTGNLYSYMYSSTSTPGHTQSITFSSFWLEKEDDWQTWLTKAGLNPSSYPNLDAVVSNQSIMQTLANSTNAVDYMIKCTGTIMGAVTNSVIAMTEIGKSSYAMDKVIASEHWTKFILMNPNAIAGLDASNPITIPTMTSNTVPSGVCGASINNATAWKVFTALNTALYWWEGNGVFPQNIGYKYTTPCWIYKVRIIGNTNNDGVKTVKIQGSDDGINYVDVSSNFVIPIDFTGTTKVLDKVYNKRYLYYRVYTIDGRGGAQAGTISHVDFYGK